MHYLWPCCHEQHLPPMKIIFAFVHILEAMLVFLAVTKQLYEHLFASVHLSVCLSVWSGLVCLSVCLSVCLFLRPSVRPSVTPFWQCSCHRIILKFSGVITIDRHGVHTKGQRSEVRGQRSMSQVMTPFSHFQTVTPVLIHIWWWNDAQSLMLLRTGTLLLFKVSRQISRSHS